MTSLLVRLVLVFVLTASFAMHAQEAPSTAPLSRTGIISSSDLLSDLAILRHAYEDMHPGLYRYNSKAEMDKKFEALQKEFSRDRSLQDAFLVLSTFAAEIKCGHTYPNFFNQKKAVAQALFQGPDRVPFYFRWLGDRMVVAEDFTLGHELPRGTEVRSINGVPASRILSRLMSIARADGSNNAKRKSYLEVTGDSVYEAFDVYFPLFFPQTGAALQLEIRRPGEHAARRVSVMPLTWEQRIAPIKAREEGRKGGSEVQFEWKFLADGNAYLRMPTWALYDSKWDWKSWLNARLDELAEKNPPRLIIDLRGNEGGNDVGDEILKRLARREIHVSSYRRLVRYREAPQDLAPYLDTWDPSFKNWGDSAKELPKAWPTTPPVHYFALSRFDDDPEGGDVIKPSGKPYRGKVFVLIDSSNSSATFQFARVVREQGLGTLVGEPTGGNLRGINGGAFFFLRLPKSQIEMDLPLIGTFPEAPQLDAGLDPDLRVTTTLDDIAKGNDPYLRLLANVPMN